MINPKQTALLIIDMQNDFVEEGAIFEVPKIRKNLNSYKAFIDFCREKGATIIYTRHCYDPKQNPIEARLFPELKRGGLRKETRGWQIYDVLKPEKNDTVINKTRYDAFYDTKLDNILRSKKINTLIITGTMTEVCCESTARSAMFRDYKILFCDDLTYTFSQKTHKHTLKVIASHFGDVTIASKIMKTIR